MGFKEIFEFIFRIEPATGNLLIDLLLPSILSLIFYGISYQLVGDAYDSGIISGSDAGSALHWFIRCVLVYGAIWIFNFLFAYWYVILIVAVFIGAILLLKVLKDS